VWYRPWDFYLGCAVSAVFWMMVGIAAAAHSLRQRPSLHAEARLPLLVDRSAPANS